MCVHIPQRRVVRTADFFQPKAVLEFGDAHHVVPQGIITDFQFGIITPTVGVSDFCTECGQFFQGFFFGSNRHPFQFFNPHFICTLQILNQLLHALFRRGGKVFFNVQTADFFAQGIVQQIYRAFPPCLGRGLSRHGAVVKIKCDFVCFVVQQRHARINHAPF